SDFHAGSLIVRFVIDRCKVIKRIVLCQYREPKSNEENGRDSLGYLASIMHCASRLSVGAVRGR
ncbi:hypothetical protein N8739_09225, partial [Luminiphilus sp.]|nr:hypothetical protein [Luminiphilus sp.]